MLIFGGDPFIDLFHTIKDRITARQAALHYGLDVNHAGMALCPFHNDHAPSLKLDTRFHCFGCGADGDVIDFAARLLGLSRVDAARRLAQDFGIESRQEAAPSLPRKSDARKYHEAEQHCFRVLADYHRLLRQWKQELAPASPDEPWDPRFTEALRAGAQTEAVLDLFIDGTLKDRAAWIAEHGKELIALERRLSELAPGAQDRSHGDHSLHGAARDRGGCPEPAGPER